MIELMKMIEPQMKTCAIDEKPKIKDRRDDLALPIHACIYKKPHAFGYYYFISYTATPRSYVADYSSTPLSTL